MLKQDQLQEEAAKVRVTPEELVAAVAELQAHKEGQSGTIAIGDAVRELSLEESPADLLRTIEAQRAQQVRTRTQKRKKRVAAAAAAAALMLVSAGAALRSHHAHPIPAPTVSTTPAETFLLSSVRDEQQVYVDTIGLSQLLQRIPASEVQVWANNESIRWGLIKHKSKIYIQAYTLRTTEKALMTNPVVIVNSEDHYGPSRTGFYDNGTWHETVKVTLPVMAFQYQDAEETGQNAQMTVSDVLPDSHLWDGFEDRFAQ